jgi:hypothetical protein
MFAMFDTFGSWLQEQQDRKDAVGEFARVIWTSFTSGDCPYYSGALDWREHYKQTLPDEKFAVVNGLLIGAFKAYADDILNTN